MIILPYVICAVGTIQMEHENDLEKRSINPQHFSHHTRASSRLAGVVVAGEDGVLLLHHHLSLILLLFLRLLVPQPAPQQRQVGPHRFMIPVDTTAYTGTVPVLREIFVLQTSGVQDLSYLNPGLTKTR